MIIDLAIVNRNLPAEKRRKGEARRSKAILVPLSSASVELPIIMEALHLMPTCCHAILDFCPVFTFPTRRLSIQMRPHRLFASLKKYDFQDFQDYAKPTRLLPATEVKVYTNASPGSLLSWFGVAESESFYKILFRTSSIYGSGLDDLNAGILICIIDKKGDSILQRISSSSNQDDLIWSEDTIASDVIHFQRGSVDEFAFQGPKLGSIQAIWIGVESGRWRLGGVNLIVISRCNSTSGQYNENETQYISVRYDFEAQEILLGESRGMLMAELKPSQVTEYPGENPISLLRDDVTKSELLSAKGITYEESMREYAHLKLSLFLYDAVLIFAGTSVASMTAGENTALAFLTGGIGGFLYLLLLQKSVDRLPASEALAVGKEGGPHRQLGGLKGPLLVLAFASGLAILITKHGSVGADMVLTPKEVMFGLMGFLVCKVAVVLAAFKPLSIGSRDGS
ncbi:hypothetical protein Nepgr_001929 [Nepenthes gracilis]|uniref:DUF7755 domain-containing protein n=1 Tax=Nepenthes gracilis TaxID=150966 RepID=A0AAD3P375_NEPGR|nr:hypothetical protein Nepgr_001929 [Nepenthes gracilis]